MATSSNRDILAKWIEENVQRAAWYASDHEYVWDEIIRLFTDVGITIDRRDLRSTALDEDILPIATFEQLESIGDQMGFPKYLYGRDDQDALWEGKPLRLFISHITEYKANVGEIKTELKDYGIAAFVAHDDLVPGADWRESIHNALDSMDGLFAYLTPGFHESEWTDQEVGAAIGRRIFALSYANGIQPYGFIGRWQAITIKGLTGSELANEIVDACLRDSRICGMTVDAIISAFTESNMWETAKRRFHIWRKVEPLMSTAQKSRVKWAYRCNDQLHDSFYVRDHIPSFYK